MTAWEYTRDGGGAQVIDWVSNQQLTGTLVIEPTGRFDFVVSFPWGQGQDYGQLTVQEDAVYWDGEDEELVGVVLAGTTLRLHWPETELVDIDQDGQPEESWLNLTLRLQ